MIRFQNLHRICIDLRYKSATVVGRAVIVLAEVKVLGLRACRRPCRCLGPLLTVVSTSECPVIEAWSQSQLVLQRLLKKNVLIMSGSSLNRDTCVENRELLVPLINLVGFLDG